MESLQDKTAIITGGGSGIGRGTALALARRGARVVVADINTEAAEATASQIAEAGGTAVGLHADVTGEGTFEELKAAALDQFGRVDVVMNNVGVLTRGLPEYLPVAEWQRIFEVNLMSVVRSNAVFLPLLISQGHGHIVNTSSFAGLYSYSYDRMPYGAAKAALVQISEGLRLYLHPQGIGVTLLCPGPVTTNIMASRPPTFGPETETRGLGQHFPFLDPADVGEQVSEAILADTFMVFTHPQVRDLLIERATDWNAFIEKQTQEIARG
jgi:NAD(P)-dependent dehydrogenase (short-subunit alcohol dehydrogenase family)